MLKGIRGRIISTFLFLILISMAVLGIILIWLLQNYYISNIEESLQNQARLVADLLNQDLPLEQTHAIEQKVKDLGRQLHVRVTIVLPGGQVAADSIANPLTMGNHAKRPEIREAFEGKVGNETRFSTTTGAETMYVAVPIKAPGKIVAAARVSLSLGEINRTFLKLRGILFSGIFIATLIAVLLSLKLAKGLTGPIESISEGTRKITAGDWNTRVYAGTQDEIGELGRTINFMTRTLKEQIDEVSQEKSRLENILHTMASGVIVLDNYGLVKIINPSAEEMFGVSSATAGGKHNLEVIRHFGLHERIEKCLEEERIIEYEFSIPYPEALILQCYIAPVYRDKALAGITIVFHDITKLRRLEQVRADFVANASHELRTPLTVIKGYAETLLNGALDDREVSHQFVSVIDQESDRLKRLVEELLILSQVESHWKDNQDQVFDLQTVAKAVANEMKSCFNDKKISLQLQLPGRLSPVKANQDRIKQVLVNLLDNALKYTPAGGNVILSADDEEEHVKIKVQDTGIGIPSKDLSRIFERFYRVDKARTRQMGGFGLGLSIVKHIIETYEGKIGVESTLNKGSTFWFTLPKVNG